MGLGVTCHLWSHRPLIAPNFWEQNQVLIMLLICSNTPNPAWLREECSAFTAGWATWG